MSVTKLSSNAASGMEETEELAHSPAPWGLKETDGGFAVICEEHRICTVTSPAEFAEGDAVLMSYALEMREALISIVGDLPPDSEKTVQIMELIHNTGKPRPR
ncbi:hypothetical protein [Adhaeribacter soli]|uniref:Uncharacterized protein n=1 Tax=Adhaeribacter soli TaxID=2607655 RepID=A0A5N1ISB8_9BACT|nr:hypothetical protein [Adhaeribacter soli]KAA9332811.1 hypothetical protein F0P94_12510 [Adhaeribacter soli]